MARRFNIERRQSNKSIPPLPSAEFGAETTADGKPGIEEMSGEGKETTTDHAEYMDEDGSFLGWRGDGAGWMGGAWHWDGTGTEPEARPAHAGRTVAEVD